MTDAAVMALPAGFWLWPEDQTWAQPLAGGRVRIGITALGLKASGEIYMCRPKPLGSEIEQGRSIGVVELSKSIVAVKSPLSGVVTRVNDALEDRPELVHESPYDAGWLAELDPSRLDDEKSRLAIDEGAIREAMAQWALLNRLDGA
ncbi:glycine cleavage system protein H [Roseateles sp.]|uniref:glycine cleavage system protein H n=1 Tax=Roseateles sp. TaxID=1971397 RepID=UPI0039E929BA